MGLLDSVLGSVMNNMGGTSANGDGQSNPLLQMAMQMLTKQGENGQSGLADIVSKFQQGGLGDIAASWVGTGENQPVSADQISSVLGSGKLSELASQFGLSTNDIAGGLSKILPDLVNQATPNGEVPQSNDLISSALSMFLKK
jgi:uncharacterized protein YidB (DUF937 family)